MINNEGCEDHISHEKLSSMGDNDKHIDWRLAQDGYILLCTDDAQFVWLVDEILRVVLRRDPCGGWRLPSDD